MIEAACHCGAVKLSVPARPDTVTECNCSICRRLGARWAYYSPSEVGLPKPGSSNGEPGDDAVCPGVVPLFIGDS